MSTENMESRDTQLAKILLIKSDFLINVKEGDSLMSQKINFVYIK
jgi:hypothetical protein